MATRAQTKKKKTQEDDLKAILKSLGYKSVDEMPARMSLEDKLFNGRLTVREAAVLDLYSRGLRIQPAVAKTEIGRQFAQAFPPESGLFGEDMAPAPESSRTRISAVANSTAKAGFSLDTPFREIVNSREALEKISQVGSIDPNWSSVFRSVEKFAITTDADKPIVYKNPKDVGSGLRGAKQSRETKKFKGVPPAKDAFPEVVAGLSTIDDPSTRNALVASSLAPYRPGEIANLRIGKYDPETVTVARAPGYFDPVAGEIVFPEGSQLKTKSALEKLKLDKNSILYQVLISQAQQAEALGTDELFPNVDTGVMTKAIQENITPRMAQFEGILGRPFDEAKDFRKLLASMIVGELGYATEADTMMGHSTDAQINAALTKINSKHYVSQIVRSESPLTAVELALENMIGEAIGAQSFNETAVSFGLDIPGYTDLDPEDPKVIPITTSGQQLGDSLTVENRPLTDAELGSLETRREKVNADNYEAAQQATKRAQLLEEENIARERELETQRAERKASKDAQKAADQAAKDAAEADKLKFTDEEKKGLGTFFNKVLGRKGQAVVTGVEAGLTALGISTALTEKSEARPLSPAQVGETLVEELTIPGMIVSGAKEVPGLARETAGFLAEPVEEAVQKEAEEKGLAGDTEAQLEGLFGLPPRF